MNKFENKDTVPVLKGEDVPAEQIATESQKH